MVMPLLLDGAGIQGPLFQGIIAFLEGGDINPALREAQKATSWGQRQLKALLPGPGRICYFALALIEPTSGTPRRMRRHTAELSP